MGSDAELQERDRGFVSGGDVYGFVSGFGKEGNTAASVSYPFWFLTPFSVCRYTWKRLVFEVTRVH